MRGAAGRSRRASEDDAQHIRRADLLDERAEVQKLLRCRRRVPGANVGATRRAGSAPSARRPRPLRAPREGHGAAPRGCSGRVLTRIEQSVEPGDVDAGGVVAGLERLHERRPRARERIENASARRDVALEQRLDELRDELAEVGVQAMDVLRPLALGQRGLRPGQLEIVRRRRALPGWPPRVRIRRLGVESWMARAAYPGDRLKPVTTRAGSPPRARPNPGQPPLVDGDHLEPTRT